MTTPSPREVPGEESPLPGAAPGRDEDAAELPADLEAFLVRLGKSVQRSGLYPDGHPALERIVDEVLDGLSGVFSSRDRISLGVSPERLVHEEGESDPGHPLLSGLAGHLHDHHISRITFRPGVEREEMAEFLNEAARPPESSEEALGHRRELLDAWTHVIVEPVRYEGLSMAEEAGREVAQEAEVEGEARDLWLGLARSVVAEEALEDLDEDETPGLETMVSALGEVTADRARAKAVAARMVALAQMLRQGDDESSEEVRERFLRLIQEVGPDTVGKLLAAAPQEQRQAFLEATADWLPAGTVVELLDEVADSRSLDISYQMIRLLSKLASYADLEADALDPEAGAAFRDQLKRVITGWKSNIQGAGLPEGDDEGLSPRHFAGPGTPVIPDERVFVDPGRVVRTAVEVGTVGPLGRQAVQAMVDEFRADELLEILRRAPEDSDATEEIWEALDVPEAIRQLLSADPPDFDTVDALLERRAAGVAGPLLDVLSESESRSVRRQLFSRIVEMEGSDVTDAILARVDDDRWFVKRNMLALLVEREEHPEGFEALPYTRHSRAEVRKEAYKLAFQASSDRVEAVRRALADGDPKALTLGLGALEEMPDEAVDEVVPQLRRRLEAGDLSPELARHAVRALGRSGAEEAFEGLLELCRSRSLLRFWTVDLADKSPLVLEAIRALSLRWYDRPEARRVLARARKTDDPDFQEAADAGTEAA